jgi:AcrR family transcriptional regulator
LLSKARIIACGLGAHNEHEVMLKKNDRSVYHGRMIIRAPHVPLSPSKGESTRTEIIRQALDLAEAQGLQGLTIGRVAERVGMSKSGVFAHFGAREDLQLAVLEAATQAFGAFVFAPAMKQKRGLARLRAVLENIFDYYQQLPHGCVILSASHEFDDQPGAVRDAVLRYLEKLRAELFRAVRYAIAEPSAELAPHVDAEQLCFECFGIFLAVHHQLKAMRDSQAIARGRIAMHRLLGDYARINVPRYSDLSSNRQQGAD